MIERLTAQQTGGKLKNCCPHLENTSLFTSFPFTKQYEKLRTLSGLPYFTPCPKIPHCSKSSPLLSHTSHCYSVRQTNRRALYTLKHFDFVTRNNTIQPHVLKALQPQIINTAQGETPIRQSTTD